MATVFWWFFAMIFISSYTANMAAFMTFVRQDESIRGVEDLPWQNKIKYGVLRGGSTVSFFNNSDKPVFQRMWNVMQNAEPSVFVSSNFEGVKKVLRSRKNYVFFMESTNIEYVMNLHCNLARIGQTLDFKTYGIGMPKSIDNLTFSYL